MPTFLSEVIQTLQKNDMMNFDPIILKFKNKYGYLSKYGLKIEGIANLIDDIDVISVDYPFIFDKRKLPQTFMGLDVRGGSYPLPHEFENINSDNEYVWAYQRFEEYVDNHSELIRKTLNNPTMIRDEMLDALCFGDFIAHKQMCIKWEAEGIIPKWNKK